MIRKPIPLFLPSCTQVEIDAITEVLKSQWWGLGAKTEEFEEKFAKYVGSKYAVAVTNATMALDLTLKAYDIHNGEVILPAFTFVSTGLSALYNNNKVVFADINEDTLCVDWEDIREKITGKTRAIIPVHYAGTLADVLTDIMNGLGINIIEDAAHATGNPLVAQTNTACWSFHVVKNLATGDGGMITTNDKKIYEKLLPLRWVGINKSTYQRLKGKKYTWDYDIESIGYKCHMNDITAALGLAQLSRIEELNGTRKAIVLSYLEELKNTAWLRLPKWDKYSSWHMFVVRIDAKNRNKFIDHMLKNGVSAGVHYKPLNTYSIFPKTKLSVTDRVWKTLVTLPLYPDMTAEEFEYIIKTIKKFNG